MTYYSERQDFLKGTKQQLQDGLLDKYLLPPHLRVARETEYALCMDLEATCEDGPFERSSHEVIEIGIVLLDLSSGIVINTFRTLVKPVKTRLTPFCERLTHITNQDVQNAPAFTKALEMIGDWMGSLTMLKPPPLEMKHPLTRAKLVTAGNTDNKDPPLPGFAPWYIPRNFVWITHGEADFEKFLAKVSCTYNNVILPPFMLGEYIDLMHTFVSIKGGRFRRIKLQDMCRDYGMRFQGVQHTALDDARCVSALFMKLLQRNKRLALNRNSFIDMGISNPGKVDSFFSKLNRQSDYRYTPVEKYDANYLSNVSDLLLN